jgi:uncharacterized membrane protein YccC
MPKGVTVLRDLRRPSLSLSDDRKGQLTRVRMRLLDWLATRDRGFSALRRAGRTAIVMPAMLALGDRVIGNPTVAIFAAFGSFAMLLLVDFGGPIRDRLRAQALLAVVDGAFVCLATLASHSVWIATVAMSLVAFTVLFAGVISSVLAGATTSLLLAFILPVSLAGPDASIPDRLAGWGMASGASLLAISLLWPAPARDPLRDAAVRACRALSARLRSDVDCVLAGEDAPAPGDHGDVAKRATTAVAELRGVFFATPYRPTGLSTATRMVVRLVDELTWLGAVVDESAPRSDRPPIDWRACAVRSAAARVIDSGAELLAAQRGSATALRDAVATLREAVTALELGDALQLRPAAAGAAVSERAVETRIGDFISSLDPSFRAQELSFVVSQIATNVDRAAAADRRSWLARLLGRAPAGSGGALSSAQDRAAAHAERHSVWLHNSLRGAAGLGLAVLVAQLTGVQHGFWVVFGALSVLRSNALTTGQNVLRGLLGTTAGFVVGAALVAVIGTNTTVLWLLLPVAVLLAGLAPAAVSFAAGQAAFTLTLLILFNILEPAGWQIGLVRIEDVALGGAVSLAVGLLLWPRGAAAALGTALAEAYVDSARYLAGAVEYGMSRCDRGAPSRSAPTDEEARAAAASRRLDDTFRGYLAERGAKHAPLAEVAGLVTGVTGLRLAADAVLDLWQRDAAADGDRAAARAELLASAMAMLGWYDGFAISLARGEPVPQPLPRDEPAAARLIEAVIRDLRREDGQASATAARMIWTGDHLDAARQLQTVLVEPARALAAPRGGAHLLAAFPRIAAAGRARAG